MKTLVGGWFSFESMGASAGDLMARDLVCRWLDNLGEPFDIALAAPFEGGVSWESVDPQDYSHVLFVCGPLGNGPPVDAFLERFSDHTMVGVNLTMLHDLEDWNPFDVLIERDSSATANPDICFAFDGGSVPVVALTLIDSQPEYGSRNRLADANQLIMDTLGDLDVALVPINTRLDDGQRNLRSAAAVESLIARADVVVSTRLHGMVLGLKNGVPVLALDSVSGGGKIVRQADAIGWPVCLMIDEIGAGDVQQAFEWCLSEEARAQARAVASAARATVEGFEASFRTAYQ